MEADRSPADELGGFSLLPGHMDFLITLRSVVLQTRQQMVFVARGVVAFCLLFRLKRQNASAVLSRKLARNAERFHNAEPFRDPETIPRPSRQPLCAATHRRRT